MPKQEFISSDQVDSQRALRMAAKRETLATVLSRVKLADDKYMVKGAPERLRGPYRTAAGAMEAIKRMLRYADAFELKEVEGTMQLVQTHHTGARKNDGTLKRIKPPRRQAKPGKRSQVVDLVALATDEDLQARQDARDEMVAHAVEVAGMKVAQAQVEAEVFLFPALEAGEKPEDVVARWKEQKGPSEEDPEGLEGLQGEE